MIFFIGALCIVSWLIGAIMGYIVGIQPIIQYPEAYEHDDFWVDTESNKPRRYED